MTDKKVSGLERFARRPKGEGSLVLFEDVAESKLMFSSGRFAFINADRDPAFLADKDRPEGFFKARADELAKDLVACGYVFYKGTGGFDGVINHHRFMIFNPDKRDMRRLAGKYGQTAFEFPVKGKIAKVPTGGPT